MSYVSYHSPCTNCIYHRPTAAQIPHHTYLSFYYYPIIQTFPPQQTPQPNPGHTTHPIYYYSQAQPTARPPIHTPNSTYHKTKTILTNTKCNRGHEFNTDFLNAATPGRIAAPIPRYLRHKILTKCAHILIFAQWHHL
jgi:hypothetical protein